MHKYHQYDPGFLVGVFGMRNGKEYVHFCKIYRFLFVVDNKWPENMYMDYF